MAPRFSVSWIGLEDPSSTELTPSFLRHQAKSGTGGLLTAAIVVSRFQSVSRETVNLVSNVYCKVEGLKVPVHLTCSAIYRLDSFGVKCLVLEISDISASSQI